MLRGSPRNFASASEAVGDTAAVVRRARPLAAAYLRGSLDPELRERVLVAVSRVNSCRGCAFVHERLATRAGVSSHDLEAIGLGEIGNLDDRSRAAVAYAAALAQARFRRPVPSELISDAADHLAPDELRALEALARATALANLSVNTVGALVARLRSVREPKRHQAELRRASPE